MRTNDLFREVLDGRIPLARKRVRPGFYFLPNLADPTAPTVAELNAGIDLSHVVTIGAEAAWDEERAARNRAITEAAVLAGRSFADMEAAFLAFGEASRKASHGYVMPPPPYPTGNIATQKRRRKL